MPVTQLLAAGIGSQLENVSTLDPASPSAESIRYLFLFLCAVSVFILAVVWGVLFYSLLRFRLKQAAGAGPAMEPPQVYGSVPIEIAWTVAPGLIVFLLALVILRTELEVRINPSHVPKDAKPLYVTVIGHQWWWEYVIDDEHGTRNDGQVVESQQQGTMGDRQGVITANELHIPVSSDSGPRPTFFTLQSADVCHSFWVPRLAGKTDLIPGRTNSTWLETVEPGLYLGQCAEYCGTQHANMLLRVYVDSPSDFAAWLANEQKSAVDEPSARDGQKAFLAQSCVNCHTIRGTTAYGKVGPDLTHLAARKTLAAGMIEFNHDNLRRWIADPQKIKPGALMPAFGDLGGQNLDLITDYLMTLK